LLRRPPGFSFDPCGEAARYDRPIDRNPPDRIIMTLLFARVAIPVLCWTLAHVTAALAADPGGTWLTQKGDARIRVAKCGTAMCGTVVWLREPADPATGQPQADTNNPDPAKRGRRILGLTIFAMQPTSDGNYAGDIYNADDGHTYRGKMVRRDASRLEVQGCAGVICGSETWSLAGR
jgi:uncharacterized protein (DUF2147 family)